MNNKIAGVIVEKWMSARNVVVQWYVTGVISAIDFMFAQENGENGSNYTRQLQDVVVNIASSLKNA